MTPRHHNVPLALSLAAFVVGMVLLAYASVPLYRLFCRSTGFGGVPTRDAASSDSPVLGRTVTVRFDANTNSALPWSFRPAQSAVTVRIGEQRHVAYIAENLSGIPTTGTASTSRWRSTYY